MKFDLGFWRVVLIGLCLGVVSYSVVFAWLVYPWYLEDAFTLAKPVVAAGGVMFMLARNRAVSYWSTSMVAIIVGLAWGILVSRASCFDRSFWLVDFDGIVPGFVLLRRAAGIALLCNAIAFAVVRFYRVQKINSEPLGA